MKREGGSPPSYTDKILLLKGNAMNPDMANRIVLSSRTIEESDIDFCETFSRVYRDVVNMEICNVSYARVLWHNRYIDVLRETHRNETLSIDSADNDNEFDREEPIKQEMSTLDNIRLELLKEVMGAWYEEYLEYLRNGGGYSRLWTGRLWQVRNKLGIAKE
jgi:hypothetical protein